MSALESFVTFSRPPPAPIFASAPIDDRDSTFIAYIFRVSSQSQISSSVTQLRKVLHAKNPASHEMHAYRLMSLKAGRDGLKGPDDFELRTGMDDDGEKYGGARILKVMEAEGVLDAVVVCSRWYGGTMLGPVRFQHIEACTREVCRLFRTLEQVEELILTLEGLDEEIIALRSELASLTNTASPSSSTPLSGAGAPKKQDYVASLLQPQPDLAKAQRLIRARTGTINTLKNSIQKHSSGS
ncbi:ribosomal protein S5 domain 2-like protein [Clavulina sp. PMI_390]|nr:ribosomal protein S5 domain 2-like protein [Clavulina sp. PMI_390]